MISRTILDVVDAALGFELNVESVDQLKRGSGDALQRALDALRPALREVNKAGAAGAYLDAIPISTTQESARAFLLGRPQFFEVAKRRDFEVRHFYPLDVGYPAASALGSTIHAPDTNKVLRNIKRALLYPHSIVIPEALTSVLHQFDEIDAVDDAFQSAKKDPMLWLHMLTAGEQMLGYLKLLAHIRALVEEGIIFLVPASEIDLDGYLHHSAFADDGRLVNRPGIFDSQDWKVYASSQLPQAVEPSDVILPMSLLALIFHTTRYDGTLFFSVPKLKAAYDVYVNYISGRVSKKVSEGTAIGHLISEAGDILLPSFDKLSLQDLVLVRKNDATFAEWRNALARALAAVDKIPTGASAAKLFVEAIHDELLPAKFKIEESVKKSSLLSSGRTAGLSFALGALGGAAAGELRSAIITGAVTGAGSFLADYLRKRKEIEQEKAFLALYSSLTPSPAQ